MCLCFWIWAHLELDTPLERLEMVDSTRNPLVFKGALNSRHGCYCQSFQLRPKCLTIFLVRSRILGFFSSHSSHTLLFNSTHLLNWTLVVSVLNVYLVKVIFVRCNLLWLFYISFRANYSFLHVLLYFLVAFFWDENRFFIPTRLWTLLHHTLLFCYNFYIKNNLVWDLGFSAFSSPSFCVKFTSSFIDRGIVIQLPWNTAKRLGESGSIYFDVYMLNEF